MGSGTRNAVHIPDSGLDAGARTVINRLTGMEPAQNEEIPSPFAKGRLAFTGP